MDHSWLLDSWLNPEMLVGFLPALKIVFWSLLALLILLALKRSLRGDHHRTIGRAYRIFFSLIALLFAGVLAYQATWQLAGFARTDFVQFMKRYNRRPDNPASRIVRGSIFDARGAGLAVTDPEMPGKRWYPGREAFCHIIGYEHPFYGLTGIEASDHALLSGITRDTGPEWERFRRNLIKRDELRGNDLSLTLNAALQNEVHGLMKGKKGAFVALDPATGAILTLYSSPGYDPNRLSPSHFEDKDPDARMLNRALHGLYPPGSTFKIMIAAAALERGMEPTIDCPADGYRAGVGNKPIRDHEYYDYQKRGQNWPGHGSLSMRNALAKSSNVYFARLGTMIGGENLHAMVVKSGLTRAWVVHEGSSGNLTGATGRFPPLSNRDIAKTAQVSIGQGDMLVTPLYMALLAGAVGQDGALYPPRLGLATPIHTPTPIMSSESARRLAGMMRQVVTGGTGRAADMADLNVAGKTGTAQNPHGADHGWFVGFAPLVKPRVAFAVVIEQGGYGSQSALPVAAGFLRKAQELGLFADQPPTESN
jgi:peptidoglycan glycosyltransferase